MRKLILIISFIIATLSGYSQSCETIETNVPVWYGDRQLEPYDESETMQIILDRNDTTFINTSTQGIYICNLLNSTGGGGSTVTIAGQEDLSSSNTISFDWTNEAFNFLNITNEIRLLDRTDCVEGRKFAITIPTGGRIAHNYTASGANRPFILNGSTDINATEKTSIMFVAYDTDQDNTIDVYREVGRATATEVDPPPVTIEFTVQVANAEITAAGGTLTLTPSVTFSSGTVKLYDGIGNEFSLTSGVAQNISYVVSDLGGESEKDFMWILETTNPDDITILYFDACNISSVCNITKLQNITSVDFSNNKITSFVFADNTDFNNGVGLKINDNLLTEILDLSKIKISFSFEAQNNADLEQILFSPLSNTITGTGSKFNITGTSFTGNLDLSSFTFGTGSVVTCNNLAGLTSLELKDVAHTTNRFIFNDTGLFGEVTIPANFTNTFWFFFYNCAGITSFNFEGACSLLSFSAFSCGLIGSLDLSNVTFNGTCNVSDNSNLTGIVFGTITLNSNDALNVENCNITGVLDLSSVTFSGTASDIRADNNSLMTGITWNGSAQPINELDIPGCAFTATEINEALVVCVNGAIGVGIFRANGGTNSAPDASSGGFDGVAAAATLVSSGWTVITN